MKKTRQETQSLSIARRANPCHPSHLGVAAEAQWASCPLPTPSPGDLPSRGSSSPCLSLAELWPQTSWAYLGGRKGRLWFPCPAGQAFPHSRLGVIIPKGSKHPPLLFPPNDYVIQGREGGLTYKLQTPVRSMVIIAIAIIITTIHK